MKAGKSFSGFTLVELTVILVIVGILAVVVVPRFSQQNYENTRATTELIQGIRYAQFQSLYRSAAPGFRIAINGAGFTVLNGAVPPVVVPDPANPSAPYIRAFPGIAINPPGAGNILTIIFDGRGQPTCIGVPCAAADLVLNVSGDVITMERFTGFVH